MKLSEKHHDGMRRGKLQFFKMYPVSVAITPKCFPALPGPSAYTWQDDTSERSSLLAPGSSVAAQEQAGKIVKAAFYGVQVFYSFFIM